MPSEPTKAVDVIAKGLEGKRIKVLFRHAEVAAQLHTTLTSKRGHYFRKQLLHRLGEGGGLDLLRQLRQEAGVQEYDRHLQKLLQFHLVERSAPEGKEIYTRTALGEAALNAVRELEREIDKARAQAIYEVSLGPHSVQLFLRVYADQRPPDFQTRKIKYTPQEVGQLARFLPRTVEALTAIDKLNEAGLLTYEDDGNVYGTPILLRGFYKYLTGLHDILVKGGFLQQG